MPARSLEDWKQLLADPELHWKAGRSAMSLAEAWQLADGFPPTFAAALTEAGLDLELLLALPEHQVPLPGGSRPSQTDLFVIARRSVGGLVAIAVEGKAGESFGPRVGEWLQDDQGGKRTRLSYLLEILGIEQQDGVQNLRYQLLHRTASALIEADRFGAETAVMTVHAFADDPDGWADYEQFARVLAAEPARGRFVRARSANSVELWLGWVEGR